jgi:hypothetical protein
MAAAAVFSGIAHAEGNGRGVVSGTVQDAQGKPLEGVRVWIKPSITTGLVQARTGPDGRYEAQGLLMIPYNSYAWYRTTYRDRNLCLRVAPEALNQYDSFVPSDGAVRNFKLRISGLIDDRDNIYYGGEARVFFEGISGGSTVEVKFEPLGPLADGSVGKTVVRTPKDMMIEDIPVGAYRVTAQVTEAGGRKRPARLSRKSNDALASTETTMEWESKDSCVGSFGNGLDRAYLYIR